MTGSRRALLTGAAAGLAVSLPVALVAQILAAVADDDLPALAVVALAAGALAGAVVAGWTVKRRQGPWPAGVAAGALALGVVAAVGVLRRVAAGQDHGAATALGAVVVGALAGGLGWALGGRPAARTRS